MQHYPFFIHLNGHNWLGVWRVNYLFFRIFKAPWLFQVACEATKPNGNYNGVDPDIYRLYEQNKGVPNKFLLVSKDEYSQSKKGNEQLQSEPSI